MATLQTKTNTLTIHTTLFDMLAAIQEEAVNTELDTRTTDTQIVSTVAEWMQSGRITSHYADPIRSAA